MKRDLNELKKITNNLKSKPVDQSNSFNDIENFIPQELDQSKNDIEPKSDFSETNQSTLKEDKYQFAEEVIEEENVAAPVNPLGKFGIQVQDRYEDI